MTPQMTELRCPECDKLLGKGFGHYMLELFCRACKKVRLYIEHEKCTLPTESSLPQATSAFTGPTLKN